MQSYWEEERKNHEEYESIRNNLRVSVCIIGGGLTGLSTAYYLSKSTNVAVIEKDRICSRTSGNNTGKVTSQHGVFYKYLIDSQGKEYAKKYLEANEKAIDNIEQIVNKEKIDCDFEREKAYVFTQKETEIDRLKDEQKSVDKLNRGLSKFVKTTELPIEIAGAIEFENQKQAKIIYESIILEFETPPDYRSSMSLTLDESRILIRIDAEDSTSFRSSVNSAIKWIKLSLEINNLTI